MLLNRRSIILILASLLILPFSVFANGGKEGSDGGKVMMTHWSGFTGADRPVLEKIIESFNETSTTSGIELSIMTWDVLDQKLTASFAAGSGPDFFAYGPEILGKYYDMGALIDVGEFYDKYYDASLLPSSVLDVPVFDGTVIAAPMCVFNTMIYYNKDMFAEAGISVPKTQDELFAAAKKLTKIGADGMVEQYGLGLSYSDVFQSLIWSNGIPVVDLNKNICLLDQPIQQAYIQKMADLVVKDKVSPEIASTGMDTLFNSGKIAMYCNGPWATTAHTEAGINFDVMEFPAGDSSAKVSGHPLFYIPTMFIEDKLDSYYEWMSYWLAKDQQATWAAGTGYPAIRVDMAGMDALKGTWAEKFSQSADKFTVRQYVTYKNAGKIFDEEIKNAWESVCLGESSVKDAFASAVKRSNAYMEDR
nr:extracellular solute-binding protein [uncultured Sphaerochaeta sp.]